MIELQEYIEALNDAAVFGTPVVTVCQTHISVVFVTEERAFKLKKPVDLGFVDYSTLEKRKHFCEEEVRLNRRLAPDVYLGVRSIVRTPDGLRLAPSDDPNAIDFVVEMVRLHEEDTFLSLFHRDELSDQHLRQLGESIVSFHKTCDRDEKGHFGSFAIVAKNARDNFSQSTSQIGHTVSETVFRSASRATDIQLESLESLITERDASGHTCDSHGDLRLEHVYKIGEEPIVVDCIEFNDAFRFSDPISDIAFFVMDLRIRWGDPSAFLNAYFDGEVPERLVDFYTAYRSAVRAKVHGIAAIEPELDEATRERANAKSRAHWLFAWSQLAPPSETPALILVSGLPGIGKSTLARLLESEHNMVALDSDVIRKELAGVDPTTSMRSETDQGIYTAAWTERTYAELLRRAEDALWEGKRVVVSATFHSNERREMFLRRAHAWGVCGAVLQCELSREEALRRIAARSGDASDANHEIYDLVASRWETASPFVESRLGHVSTETHESMTRDTQTALRRFGLLD